MCVPRSTCQFCGGVDKTFLIKDKFDEHGLRLPHAERLSGVRNGGSVLCCRSGVCPCDLSFFFQFSLFSHPLHAFVLTPCADCGSALAQRTLFVGVQQQGPVQAVSAMQGGRAGHRVQGTRAEESLRPYAHHLDVSVRSLTTLVLFTAAKDAQKRCPLCHADVGRLDADLHTHLCKTGCPASQRKPIKAQQCTFALSFVLLRLTRCISASTGHAAQALGSVVKRRGRRIVSGL